MTIHSSKGIVLTTKGEEYAAQVREIAELMGAGQWVIGVTENALAARWKITNKCVRERSAEARRLVAHAYGDIEDIRARVLVQLDGIAGEVRHKEPRTAVAALMGIASIAGLVQRDKPGSMGESTAKRHLSPAERLAEIERIRAALTQAEEQARAEMVAVDVPLLPTGTPED